MDSCYWRNVRGDRSGGRTLLNMASSRARVWHVKVHIGCATKSIHGPACSMQAVRGTSMHIAASPPVPTPRAFKDPLAPNIKCATNPPSKSLQIRRVSCPRQGLLCESPLAPHPPSAQHMRTNHVQQLRQTTRQPGNHSGASFACEVPPLPDMTRLGGQPEPSGFNAKVVCTTSSSACALTRRAA
jgi:hypothetical protein